MSSLFEDLFEVLQQDPDGRKFDRVSRYVCKSELFEVDLAIDINIDLWPLTVGDKFNMLISRTIHKDGTAETLKYDETFPTVSGKESLLDHYDYVMLGRVFRYKHLGAKDGGSGPTKVQVLVSFGGLLMRMVGDPSKLHVMEVDSHIYLLLRKIYLA